ncbi:unnamed protein product [Chilo suppressalis]|uniref:FP protein C-terminal domain-containing protein n=1 Tax=Chilo suppressalis TaxID=168631 RepID=A0ABN8ARY3_CHISP|nr:unnamed protein product [Chilo suppressalis]
MIRSPANKQDITYGSAPDLSEVKEDDSPDNINNIFRSNKRRRCECSGSEESTLDSFIKSLTIWKKDTDTMLSNIQESMNVIKKQNDELLTSNSEIEKSIEFLSIKYDEIHNQLMCFQTKTKENEERFLRMEEKTEELERNSRSSTLEIRNIPIPKNPSQADLVQIVTPIFKTICVEVTHSDIFDIRHFSSKSENKTVLVTLNSVILKNSIIRSYREYNKTNPTNRLNTSVIGSEVPHQQIFIAENLTPRARRLFHRAREFAKQENYKYCWTAHGKILLRKQDNDRFIVLSSESQFNELQSKN